MSRKLHKGSLKAFIVLIIISIMLLKLIKNASNIQQSINLYIKDQPITETNLSIDQKETSLSRMVQSSYNIYMMFYGEWEIVEIRDYEYIPISDPNDRHYGGEELRPIIYIKEQETGEVLKGAIGNLNEKTEFTYWPLNDKDVESYVSEIIGSKMVFDPNYIKCNDRYIIQEPVYSIYIHPRPDEMIKLYGTTDWYNMGWEELEFNSKFTSNPYYISVGIYNSKGIPLEVKGECTDFMIIDDETLIGYVGRFSVKLKRVKHIENAESYYVRNSKRSMHGVSITAEEISSYNSSYKLFYGKWKATKVLAKPKKFGINIDENTSNLIGTEVTMLREKVIIDNKVVTNYPIYQIRIIPIFSKRQVYIKGLPSINKLNIKGNFFAFVDVEDFYGDENYDSPFKSFYVVDDETLVAEQDGYYIELKRLEYIDDLEYLIEFP